MRIYDADQITIAVAGIPILSRAWADGEFISISPESESFMDVAGTGGEVVRSKTLDRRATVTIRLLQSAPENDALSVLHSLDINTPGGSGVGAFLVTDKGGTTLLKAGHCWIHKVPDISFDREVTMREWEFRVAKLIAHIGSNPSI